jgi:hypothetical protein
MLNSKSVLERIIFKLKIKKALTKEYGELWPISFSDIEPALDAWWNEGRHSFFDCLQQIKGIVAELAEEEKVAAKPSMICRSLFACKCTASGCKATLEINFLTIEELSETLKKLGWIVWHTDKNTYLCSQCAKKVLRIVEERALLK